MSIKISGTGISHLYDMPSTGASSDVTKTSRAGQAALSSDIQQQANSGSKYISKDHGGIIKTRVSDANVYKKGQIEESRDKIEKMAGKLVDRLPAILSDMRDLPAGAENEASASRVAVNERNAALVAERQQAVELQDFTL